MNRAIVIAIVLAAKIGFAIEYRAILVGIEDYKYANDLRYCVDDVEDMNLALQAFPHWNSINITILTNAHATKAAIRSKLQEMEKLCPEDLLIFHFSGHGDKDNTHSYLCPYETDPYNYATMIKDEEFQNWMNKIRARKIIILDACYCGGMAYGGLSPRGISTIPVEFIPASGGFQTVLKSLTNTVALFACKADEISFESSFLQNGVFSYYLIEALNKKVDNNGDYHTSAEEIFNYARPKTEDFVEQHYPGYEQHPQMKDNFEGDLPVDYIFVVCSAEGSIHITPALMDIDRDGKQEVFLACDDGDDDGYGMAYAFDSDWNLLWSKEVNGNVRANPCVSDLDGDGNYEFIVATTRGHLYVFNCEDGSVFSGWPQYVGCTSSSPATADFNNDGKKDIVIGTKNGVKIYSYDGHLKYTGYSEFEFVSGPVIVDIDKDGYLDIIAVANNVASPFHYPVWIRYFGGKGFEDMKLELPSQGFSGKIYNHTTPAIADIDGNGWNDIVYCPTVAAGDNGVLCVEIRGTSLYLKWDDSFNGLNDLHSSPAIADVDGDNKGEVIVAGNWNPGINYSYMMLRCYEHDGKIKWSEGLSEWPVSPYSSPSLGQLGKAWLDVAIGSDYGKLYMFSANDGYEITDPKMFALEKIASSPVIGDIDGDGKLEVVATSTDHFVYRWERGGSYYSLIEWGKFHHDNFNTGVYLSIPVGLKAEGISESEIKLTWIDKVLAEEGFEILRLSGGVWVVIDSVSSGVTEYIDRGLSPGTEYQYRVRAYCGEYFSGYSNVATGKTYWINPPFSLKVINYTSDYIKIGWQHTSSIEEAYFQIARKVDNDPWEEDYDRVDKNTFQYQDTEIEVAHRYTYKVKAVDDQGHSSPWSNEASIRIGGVAVSNYSGMTAFNNAGGSRSRPQMRSTSSRL